MTSIGPFPHPFHAALRGSLMMTVVLLLPSVAGCKKSPTPKPEIRALSWYGLTLGMSEQQVKEKVEPRGWTWRCTDAQSLMFVDGNGLYTRWLKPKGRARVKRCRAERKKGAAPGADRIAHMKMYLVDDKLVRMNVLLSMQDPELMKILRSRFGTPKSRELTRHAYASDRVARMNVWVLSRADTLMVWLRMRRRQELVFLTTDAKQIATMKSISSPRKSE